MDLWTHIREAFTNLVTAKLRSFLAILGVLVGTGSVVALISSSQLATEHALAQFKSLGTNLLSMRIEQSYGTKKKTAQDPRLTLKDMLKLKASSPKIEEVAPYINLYESLYIHGVSLSGATLGATGALADIAKIHIAKGRFVSFLDKHNFFCVIGSKVAAKLAAKNFDPMGKQIMVGKRLFTIVGIAKPWTPNLFLYSDINNGVIIPLATAYLLSKNAKISNVMMRLVPKSNINSVQDELTEEMKILLPGQRVRFQNPEQIINIVGKQRQTFTWLLTAIGGISLLVGGIGVMNIMLVSVIERRREIGIRMAIGAQCSDILSMFLIESVILTVFGGLLGIIVGVGISFVLAVVTKWEFHFYIIPPVLGFAVSALVGMLSGFYPALRASRLDPIQTLQSD